MAGEARVIARVSYTEHGNSRFIKGPVLEETDEFIVIELRNYIVKIFKKYIEKIEIEKPTNRGSYEYH